ncbi:hypothetical protein BLNAU_18646 [Blattamonas nauphoetae]|uniref:Uncharacterized protein n=1 Tax=Blattamonas nauphoetae TaxID=2049346 RepID=A0ABQ9X3Y2_9EUKA|nr:hypothetical protein BLNAU_18646 [Blattamonas nauphoetae]
MFETDIMWSMLVTLVEQFSFDHNVHTRLNIERTVKATLTQISSLLGPAALENTSEYRKNNQLKQATIHLLDFVLIEMGRLPSVQTSTYPLNMIDPLLPYLLQFVTSSDSTIQEKSARILHSVTSISMNGCIPILRNVDSTALQADFELFRPHMRTKAPVDLAAASTLIGHLSTLFADPIVSSPCIETVRLLVGIVSSLLTLENVDNNIANCLPLTLLVMALTAAPPSHRLQILTIFLEFFTNSNISIEIKKPFLKHIFTIITPDTHSDDPLIVTLSKLLTSLTFVNSLSSTLFDFLSDTEPTNTLALSLMVNVKTDQKEKSKLTVQPRVVPKITSLVLKDLDERQLSFLLSMLGTIANHSTGGRFEENEAQQIVERLLEIEQRHPLQLDAEDIGKTTTDGMEPSPHDEEKGEAGASARTGTSVNELVDVWRVMRMVVSSLAGSPSGLERLHVLYPLIFLRMKERGTSILSQDGQTTPMRRILLTALVRVCLELIPLLKTIDCFPLVHLVSSILHWICHPSNGHPQSLTSQYTQQSGSPDKIKLPYYYARLKEFFLRVDEVTQGLDAYDITHHEVFVTPSSTEDVATGADYVVSRPIPLLKYFVDFEVKCFGVKKAAFIQKKNPTMPDQTRQHLLLHLLATMNRTNDFAPSAVIEVLLSFPTLPSGTSALVHSLKNTIIVAHNPSPPVCAREICCLINALLMRAAPNEADSEERWRLVLREEGWEDLLNVILKKSLAEIAMKNGMNCTVASFLFEPSTILGTASPTDILPMFLWAEQAGRRRGLW